VEFRSGYNLGSATAEIRVDTSQLTTALYRARDAADDIQAALTRVVASINQLYAAGDTGMAESLQAQTQALKAMTEQIKAANAATKQAQAQEHKERMAMLANESMMLEAVHKLQMDNIREESSAYSSLAKAITSARRQAENRDKVPASLQRDRTNAQAESRLTALRNQLEKYNSAFIEMARIEAQIGQTSNQRTKQKLEQQLQAYKDFTQKFEAEVRTINALRSQINKDAVGYDLLTSRERTRLRKDISVDKAASDIGLSTGDQRFNTLRDAEFKKQAAEQKAAIEEIARIKKEAAAERERIDTSIAQNAKKSAAEQLAADKAAAKEKERVENEKAAIKAKVLKEISDFEHSARVAQLSADKSAEKERERIDKERLATRKKVLNEISDFEESVRDAQRQKDAETRKFQGQESVDKDKRAERFVNTLHKERQLQDKEQVESQRAIAKLKADIAAKSAADAEAALRREIAAEKEANKERAAALRKANADKKAQLAEEKRLAAESKSVAESKVANATRSVDDAMRRARASMRMSGEQISITRSYDRESPDISQDTSRLIQLKARLSELDAEAIALKQQLRAAFDDPATLDQLITKMNALQAEIDQTTKDSQQMYTAIKGRNDALMARSTVSTDSDKPVIVSPLVKREATRAAIGEVNATIKELQARFKAARVGLPITVDTTQMERSLEDAMVPIRQLQSAFAELKRQFKDLTNDPEAQGLLIHQFEALEAEALRLKGQMGALDNSMDRFEASARRATTGVRGYFNNLRIELERINQTSIGANVQQLGYQLFPAGLVATAGVARGVQTAQTLEETEIAFRGIVGDQKEALALMESLADEARRFGLPVISSVPEFAKLLPIVRNLGYDMEQFVGLAARLATLNPAQGLEGAVRAISELASGSGNDFVSIAERFNIARSALRQAMEETGRNVPEALDRVLTAYGRTNEVALEFGATSRASMNRARDAVDQFLAESMEPLLEAFVPLLENATGLFNAINEGGGFLQGFTGIAMAATAGAVTLTIALGQLIIALEAIKAVGTAGLLSALASPVGLAIGGGIAAIAGIVALSSAIDSLNQASQNALNQSIRPFVDELERAAAQQPTTTTEPVAMSDEDRTFDFGGVVSRGREIGRPQFEAFELPNVPSRFTPEIYTRLNDEIERQFQIAARNYGRASQYIRSEQLGVLGNFATGLNDPALRAQTRGGELETALRGMVLTGSVTSQYGRGLIDLLTSNEDIPISPELLQNVPVEELQAILQILPGVNQEYIAQLQATIDLQRQANEVWGQNVDAVNESREALQAASEAYRQIAQSAQLQSDALDAIYAGAATRVGAMLNEIPGGISQETRTGILQGVYGAKPQDLAALEEALQSYADMYTDFMLDSIRTAEDRARSQLLEMEDFSIGRLRALNDFARDAQRAEEDYQRSRQQAIDDYYEQEAKAQEEYEKQVAEINGNYEEERLKALENHLIDMQRIAADVDESIAARDFLAAQKQIRSMRERQEDFDREQAERKEDLDKQLEDLIDNLEEQRAEREKSFREQMADTEAQYRLQRQRAEEDFRLSLQREDEDRALRLRRQQEEYNIVDRRRVEDFNRQVEQLIAHNEVMRFNQDYWFGILEMDYGEHMARIHAMMSPADYVGYGGAAGGMGGTGGLPADVYQALIDFYNSADPNAGAARPGGWIPQYADGVDFITKEGLAYLHFGERVSKSADGVRERTGVIGNIPNMFAPVANVNVKVESGGKMSKREEMEYARRLSKQITSDVMNAFNGVIDNTRRSS